jgi:WhiB family redox-sensing transcriptional regulator
VTDETYFSTEQDRLHVPFDFAVELVARAPMYKDASLIALIQNVEMFCSKLERSVTTAYLEGTTIKRIIELFDGVTDEASVLGYLRGAVSTIANVMSESPSNRITVEANVILDSSSLAQSTETGNISVGGTWQSKAECLKYDPEIFFSEYTLDAAKEICQKCMSQLACLEYALVTGEDEGVWGGLTDDERKALKRKP